MKSSIISVLAIFAIVLFTAFPAQASLQNDETFVGISSQQNLPVFMQNIVYWSINYNKITKEKVKLYLKAYMALLLKEILNPFNWIFVIFLIWALKGFVW